MLRTLAHLQRFAAFGPEGEFLRERRSPPGSGTPGYDKRARWESSRALSDRHAKFDAWEGPDSRGFRSPPTYDSSLYERGEVQVLCYGVIAGGRVARCSGLLMPWITGIDRSSVLQTGASQLVLHACRDAWA